jgi:hypothetical protein
MYTSTLRRLGRIKNNKGPLPAFIVREFYAVVTDLKTFLSVGGEKQFLCHQNVPQISAMFHCASLRSMHNVIMVPASNLVI